MMLTTEQLKEVADKELEYLEDGFIYFWPMRGAYTSGSLRSIADLIDQINEPHERQIKEYFAEHKEDFKQYELEK